jgi:oxamate amidohydrolase
VSETVEGERGMVVAPHFSAAEAGAEVLRAGGNAIEAIIAVAATIAVVYPAMNGIGGDVFMLISEPGRPPRAIDAAGRAGTHATADAWRKKGYDTVPERGPDAAITVAGAVSGWAMAQEIATALGGRIPRAELVAGAVRHAREGIVVTKNHARLIAENIDSLRDVHGYAGHFLIDGKPPAVGEILRHPKLADTLDRIAHAGYADFYRGDIAAEIATDLSAAGTPVTRDDLRKHEARLVAPLSIRLKDSTVFNLPPPTQGVASLIILGLFDRLGVKRGESFEHHHGLIESVKRAFIVRDREVADPDFAGEVAKYLTPGWLDSEADAIDMRRAMPWPPGRDRGDTIWASAIDEQGLAVSFIQSLYWPFGSGVVLPRTGIVWQNRGAGFSLDPSSPNVLAPGKKPFHTLNPPLARFDDGRVMTYGSMGGDGQPQFQAQIFTRHARFGMSPGDAIAAPRWRLGRTWGEGQVGMGMEDRFDPDLVLALERAGHTIIVLPDAFSDDMGHAGMIVRDRTGRLLGASDPRSDGRAVAV